MRTDDGALVFCSRRAGLETAVEGLRGLYVAGAHVEPTAPDIRASVEARRIRSGVVFDRRLDGVALRRDARLVRRTAFNHFVFQKVTAGELRVASGDKRLTLRAGDTLFLDTTQPSELVFSACRVRTVSLTREHLSDMGFDVARLHGTSAPRSSATSRSPLVEALEGDDDSTYVRMTPPQPRAAAAAGPADRRERALAFIEAHLQVSGLSPEQVIAGALTSRSALYRVFEDLGGVSEWVQARRLRRLRTALETDDRSLVELAHDLGFASVSHASNAFFTRYGVRPGALREARRAELAGGRADGVHTLLADLPAALARETSAPVLAGV